MVGLSLGSTSMSKLTWNKSGYFSWMSQASKSYLTGGQLVRKEEVMEEEFEDLSDSNHVWSKVFLKSVYILCKLDISCISGDKTCMELDLKHLH